MHFLDPPRRSRRPTVKACAFGLGSLQAVSGPGRGDDTRIIEDVNKLIVTGDMVAADTVALELMKEFDPSFTKTNEGIVLRQHQHAEELGLGSGDLSKFEIIEVSV